MLPEVLRAARAQDLALGGLVRALLRQEDLGREAAKLESRLAAEEVPVLPVDLQLVRHDDRAAGVAELLVKLRVVGHVGAGGEVRGGTLLGGRRSDLGRRRLLGSSDGGEEGRDGDTLLLARRGEHGEKLLGGEARDCGHFRLSGLEAELR